MDSPLGPLEGAQCLVTQSCPTLCDLMDSAARLFCPWGLSRQECWSALPCPFLGDLPNPGIELKSPALQVDSLPSETPGKSMRSRRVEHNRVTNTHTLTQSCPILL